MKIIDGDNLKISKAIATYQSIFTDCIICGNSVELSEAEAQCDYQIYKVCEECKNAIAILKEKIKNGSEL